MKLKFTLQALNDLHHLKEFIAKKNPLAASNYIDKLLKTIHYLSSHPKLGKILEEEPLARELVAGDYIVRYAIRNDSPYILKIWHGKQEH